MIAIVHGTDIDGRPVSEAIALPDLTPEQEAEAVRANAILSKIQRGAYHTERRQARALRRYFRVAGDGGSVTGEQSFAHVTEIVFRAPTVAETCTFSVGSTHLPQPAPRAQS